MDTHCLLTQHQRLVTLTHTVRKDAHGQNHIFKGKQILCQLTQHQNQRLVMLTHTVKTSSLRSNRYTLSVNPTSKACNANSHSQNKIFTEQQIHCQLTQHQKLVILTHPLQTNNNKEKKKERKERQTNIQTETKRKEMHRITLTQKQLYTHRERDRTRHTHTQPPQRPEREMQRD